MEVLPSDTLDGNYGAPGNCANRQQTAHHWQTFQQNRTGAAHALSADQLGSGQIERIAQNFDEQCVGFGSYRATNAVDRKFDHHGGWPDISRSRPDNGIETIPIPYLTLHG